MKQYLYQLQDLVEKILFIPLRVLTILLPFSLGVEHDWSFPTKSQVTREQS